MEMGRHWAMVVRKYQERKESVAKFCGERCAGDTEYRSEIAPFAWYRNGTARA
jgi:hypothetical protein